tara:strand:+ start:4381 stop:5370 length:990 start_codon:yes stop_codon:yes gene_type:complete
MSDTSEQPKRRQVDGYFEHTDPWQGMANPDAYSNWSPTAYEIEMPERSVWEADQGNRTAAADLNYGRDGAPTQTTPGPLDLPDRGYPRGPSAWDIAERERELLWRTEDRDRDRLWRSEDRALDERLRAEKEAKDKADRIKRGAAYDAYDASMRDVYNPARVNARFDPMVTATGGAYDSGIERLGGITRAMDARGVKSRKSVADAFTAGDQRLQGIRSQYAGEQVNRVGGFNDILSGYGAGSVDQGSGYMDRMFANAQIGNARAGTIFDASSADRGALVGGLRGDIETGMTQQKAALLAKIAADRIAAQTTSDSALATALAQSGIARGNL